MNKLIQKLYDRACDVEKNTLYYITGLVHPDAMQISRQDESRTFNPEKFAELIVRECLDQITSGPDPAYYSTEAVVRIRKHFGIP